MKLSKEQLKQIIKEELEQIVSENKAEEFNQRVNKAIKRVINKNIINIADRLFRDRKGRSSLNTWIQINDNPTFADVFRASPDMETKAKGILKQHVIELMMGKLKFHSKGLAGEEMQQVFKDQKEAALAFLSTKNLPKPESTDLDDGGEYLEPIMENEEESSLEKILKILDSAKGGLRFSDLVDKTGMPKKEVVNIYQDNSELFRQIYDGGTKYKLSKRGQEALNYLLNPPTDDERRKRDLLNRAALGALGLEEEIEHKGHGGGLKLTKEQLTKIVAEELEKAKARLIDRALEVEKKGHKGSEMSAEKQAEFKSWASKQSEEALRDYINKHK